jgi:hypothetical protein
MTRAIRSSCDTLAQHDGPFGMPPLCERDNKNVPGANWRCGSATDGVVAG